MRVLKIDFQICQSNEFATLKSELAKFTSRAYFVGGCVRDALLGIKSDDFDIEIYDISPQNFENIMNKLGAKGVGKSFFVYKFGNFDLALPRTESKNGIGHRAFKVSICNDEKTASKRRDFTINSIMINIFSGEVLDFWGGRDDLRLKTLKIIDKKTFCDDTLRVLRAVQFASRFNLKIDSNSLNLMKTLDISDLSADRIRIELEKLFASKFQAVGIKALCDLNLDLRLFGVKFDKNFANLVQKHFKFTQNPKTLFYDLVHYFRVDPKKLIKNLNLDNSYKKIIKEPYFERVSRLNLIQIAFEMPLKDWLGLNTASRVNLAKKLGFYDKKINFSVENTGFDKLNLKQKLAQIQIQKQAKIKEILRKFV